MTTYRAGNASITVDQNKVLEVADRLNKGAATGFLKIARRHLGEINAEAAKVWVRRSGRSAKSFALRDDISDTSVGVTTLNTAVGESGGYGYYVKFADRTKQSLDAEAERIGRGGALEFEKGKEKALAIAFARRNGKRATGQDIATRWRARLTKFHGEGAPNEALAGKRAWNHLVRAQAKKRETMLIEESRAILDTLAGG
jgi:hypothetical protein